MGSFLKFTMYEWTAVLYISSSSSLELQCVYDSSCIASSLCKSELSFTTCSSSSIDSLHSWYPCCVCLNLARRFCPVSEFQIKTSSVGSPQGDEEASEFVVRELITVLLREMIHW